MKINKNYFNLETSYLFSTIAQRVNDYKAEYPDKKIIRLGIGDVTLPLAPVVVKAMEEAVREMGCQNTFHGYGEEQGYKFLRSNIAEYYKCKGVSLEVSEIFISDGAKSDLGNILDIFETDNTVLVPDPVYPVYVDTNIMAGRNIIYTMGVRENGFLPMPDESVKADIIYICSPNNPTGAVYNREQLKKWVDYANSQNAIILFDSAYEAFISDETLPTSIYEIEGAKTCAIEFCSLSKTAGFTGTRCGYTVVPQELIRDERSVNSMWLRRQTTKFNGVPYIVQRGAAAVFTAEGMGQTKKAIEYYMENAKIMAETLKEMEIWYCGGENSPYIWLQCPDNMSSWGYFDKLLSEANVVGTPGSGFGRGGFRYFRLTAFGNREETVEAMNRLSKM